jgi:asparagine synthase (glutamine-hydrolysing)
MCGIWTFINLLCTKLDNKTILKLYEYFYKIKHRGPDYSSFKNFNDKIFMGFHRLAIMDPTLHANQPYIFEYNNKTIIYICNGEIYNFQELINKHQLSIINNSDCMVIPKLYMKYNLNDFINLFKYDIKGEYAFIIIELDNLQNLTQMIICRDHIGIRPLYYHKPTINNNYFLFSSEIKGFFSNDPIYEFTPGTFMHINFDSLNNQYNINNIDFKYIYNIKPNLLKYENIETYFLNEIKNAVINSVKRRLMSDKPIAFLLSGGVDSSLVAAIATKLLNKPINTFCCGMTEGTDLIYARKVSDFIKSNHTEVFFTEEEGLNVLDDVIYTTETWDTTTIRASVGQYLVSKYISSTDAKVIMVGEGPDEVCSSYLFNYYAPDGNSLHETAIEYVKDIHMYDGRRADRCISKWGLECRIPLLDPEFIKIYWSIPSEWRHPKYKGIEKWWLRKAFEDSNILPHEVLWRKKEAFSDGISSNKKSWFQIIQDYIKNNINSYSIDDNNPTIEAYYFKKKFIDFFGKEKLNIIPHYWQPKWINNNSSYIDPSARILDIY